MSSHHHVAFLDVFDRYQAFVSVHWSVPSEAGLNQTAVVVPVWAALNSVWIRTVASLWGTANWTLHYFTVASHIRRSAVANVRVVWTCTVDARLHALKNFLTGSKQGMKARNMKLVPPTQVAFTFLGKYLATDTTPVFTPITGSGRAIET